MSSKRNSKDFMRISGQVLTTIAMLLGMILLGLVGVSAFLCSSVAEDMAEQKMIIGMDNIVLTALFLGISLTVGFFVVEHFSKEWMVNRLFLFTIIWYLLTGGLLIFFFRSVPGADAMATLNMGHLIANRDYSFISFTDSYLSYYPHQIGLSVFLGILIKGLQMVGYHYDYYHAIKIVYVLLNCLTYVCFYFAIKEIWSATRVRTVYTLLSIFNLPFILYSSFIYGEIPSLTVIAAGSLFLIRFLKEKGPAFVNLILSVVFFTLSVYLRKNSVIFLIAVAIVVVLHFLKTKRWELLLYIALMFTLALSVIPLTLKYYENVSGRDINSGVTMYSYFAMGMQDSERGPGWYNGYNFDLYHDTDMNTEECNRISHEYIKERTEYFKNNPSECMKFYKNKFLSQWTDSTLASCQATYSTFSQRSAFVESFYTGKINNIFNKLCDNFQNVVMVGAIIWAVHAFIVLLKQKKADKTYEYLWLIAVIGGFLFHMIWEANSRYIFTYAMLIIPYAAAGYGNLAAPFIKKDKDED